MSTPKITNRPLVQFANNYWQWKWLWISTTALFGVLGLLYVLFVKKDVWEASQGLIVRDEANGAVMRLGRFESQTEMKAAQETILEMARNNQVLSDALTEVGSEPTLFSWGSSNEKPTNGQIESLADDISVKAPRGAEFGTTEVIYLSVKNTSRARAVELNKAICDALENRLKQVRQARADGVIIELNAAKKAARSNLTDVTSRLEAIESEIGNDLSDLISLTDVSANGSQTRQTLDAVNNELRAAELEKSRIESDLEIARESFQNPEQILQTPTQLVNSQPGLKRLREGLAAASIVTSELRSKYTMSHPSVIASIATEEKIRKELRNELGTSVKTLTNDFQLANKRIEKLQNQKTSLEDRIAKVAAVRAKYGNIVREASAKNTQLQDAERELANAMAARAAAETSSLLTRIDQPTIGEDPLGPGRTTVLGGAIAAGLFFGFGLVFLLTPLDTGSNFGRRSHDSSSAQGRRASDRANPAAEAMASPRQSPQSPAPASPVPNTSQSVPMQSNANLMQDPRKTISGAIASVSNDQSFSSVANTPPKPQANSVSNAEPPAPAPAASAATPAAATEPQSTQVAQAEQPAPVPTQPAPPQPTADAAAPSDTNADQASIEAAQAVIAAALNCSFTDEANSPPAKES